MIKPVIWSNIKPSAQEQILSRPYNKSQEKTTRDVQKIIDRVQSQGDKALVYYTRQFELADLSGVPLRVSHQEIEEAVASLNPEIQESIDYAINNVRRVSENQMNHSDKGWEMISQGTFVQHQQRAIDSVGLYVPRGRGSFPSMVYMLAVPATVAGVRRKIMATPPDARGNVDPACLYAAQQCGVHEIYRVGGAQAIAAMALGTESIPSVDKILGPGSMYVATAKRLLSHIIDVGQPTGPSESMIIADHSVAPYSIALDLLVEAEHGSDSTALCVTTNTAVANRIISLLPNMINANREPQRKFLQDVFSRYGSIIIAQDIEETFEIANRYAPEHLLLHIENAESYLPLIKNAGEVIIGPYTTFPLANYATGANAILPTGGAARTCSAISVHDFQKTMSYVKVSRTGYAEIAKHVARLAKYENFPNHASAITKKPYFN